MADSRRSTDALDVWLRFLASELTGEAVDFERTCAEHPLLAEDLRALHASWASSEATRVAVAPAHSSEPIEALLSRLAEPAIRGARYRVEGDIGRGGMGVVQRVWDVDLNRYLAIKTLRTTNLDRHALARFVEEAQIAAQLDHPAIVPVHDVGVDELGRPFFVMKLVEGQDLRRVFEQAWKGEDGWNTTRVLGVLLKVCEAAGYAHRKGVIHRDLKPSNVMVGQLGEVYVMDWGVARVLVSRANARSIARAPNVTTVRSSAGGGAVDSALLTAAGDVVGTAAYMSPEQARGEIEHLTPRSDVYAVGAMLYHLIARHAPYVEDGATSAEVLERVRSGPPPQLAQLDVQVAPEIAAICDKAMARDAGRRYADLSAFADDLRAYLEGRVVLAHRSGLWTAAQKWVRRNRALSTSLAALLVIVGGAAWVQARSSVVRANFDRLTRLRQQTDLLTEYELLWPASERSLPALERWLAEAERVATRVDEYDAQLKALRERAEPWNREAPAERAAERELDVKRRRYPRYIEYLERQCEMLRSSGAPKNFEGMTLSELEAQLKRDRPNLLSLSNQQVARRTWTFASAEDQLLHDRLVALITDVEKLVHASEGFSRIERVRHAVAFVRDRGAQARASERALWEAAITSIGDPAQCPQYAGLVLTPQTGLLPIGRDPRSGLWEFAHLQSGEPARRTSDGVVGLREESGIVLVLLPGAHYVQGTQNESPSLANFDPNHQQVEGPLTPVVIDPFFLSKYEMTQAQWMRWTGHNPSNLTRGAHPELWFSELQPVETVDWWRVLEVLRELGLTLPCEAQWEYAARGGTPSPWPTPEGVAGLARHANLADSTYYAHYRIRASADARVDPRLGNDGFAGTAPVGSFEPNPFGLHDVLGNVSEWCADVGALGYGQPRYLGTGERSANFDAGSRAARGGDLNSLPIQARYGARQFFGPNYTESSLGLRPARAVEP